MEKLLLQYSREGYLDALSKINLQNIIAAPYFKRNKISISNGFYVVSLSVMGCGNDRVLGSDTLKIQHFFNLKCEVVYFKFRLAKPVG